MRKTQNYSNHVRLVRGYHGYTFFLLLLLIIGSISLLINSDSSNWLTAALLLLIACIFASFFWYARSFALKAQDRAIRAEESLRYYVLTGKTLPAGLRMGQIVALRFASDEEFPSLVDKALQDSLSNKEIKKLIQNWRADYNRV